MANQITAQPRKKQPYNGALEAEAEKRERQYQNQRRLSILVNSFGYSLLVCIALFFGMLLAGDRFSGILAKLGLEGLSNEQRGVYADCSKASNRSNPYCQKHSSSAEKNWEAMRKGGKGAAPFSLSE